MLDQAPTRNEVSQFGVQELFFSRTDKRGVICAGNEVFYRVSKYAEEDMVGAPHKIVRHPDMPKAVFWLAWDMLGKGETVGAYVKNRASDGSYYWVFAIMSPVSDGYLSVRLKPTTERLEQIESLYSEIRHKELTEDVSAEESAHHFLARLSELGWASYASFMAESLINEVGARNTSMATPAEPLMKYVEQIQENARQSVGTAQSVLDGFSMIAGFPVNMHIQASKLKANGRIFGSIADNYERLSKRIERSMRDFIEARQSASATVDNLLFRLVASGILHEMATVFETEANQKQIHVIDEDESTNTSFDQEIAVLNTLVESNTTQALARMNAISSEYTNFSRLIEDIQGILNGLSVTQFVGLVETARLDRAGETLKAMLQDVTSIQNDAANNLKQLSSLNRGIASQVNSLSKSLATSK